MQKIFFTVLLVVTVLVTVRLHNYKQETTGLFANTAELLTQLRLLDEMEEISIKNIL